MNYGFEIEVLGLSKQAVHAHLCAALPQYDWKYLHYTYYDWNVGHDSSVDAEVRSPILTEDKLDSLFPVLKVLKTIGCRVGRSCGFHIHVSREEGINALAVNTKLESLYPQLYWPYRQTYCGKNYGKYVPVRQIDARHVEVRVFNGTLNGHAVRNYIEIIKKIAG